MTPALVRNPGFIDSASSEPGSPHVILTADCAHPKEIDDGIIVQRLAT